MGNFSRVAGLSPSARRRGGLVRVGAGLFSVLILILTSIPCPSAGAETLTMAGTGAVTEIARKLAKAFVQDRAGIDIRIHNSIGSAGGISAVRTGRLDLGFSTRPLIAPEQVAGLRYVPIGTTPIVFVVSQRAENKAMLTIAQLKAAFEGDLTAWTDGRPLRMILRADSETSMVKLIERYPGMAQCLNKARSIRGAIVAINDDEAMSLAVKIPGAVSLGPLSTLVAGAYPLLPLALGDGPIPSVEAVENGTYPLKAEIGLVTPAGARPAAAAFVDFATSKQGAAILRANGVLPISR